MRPTNPSLSGRAPNAMFRLAGLAYGRDDLIRLELGEPGFATPEHITRAAVASIDHERQGYGPTNGPLWLREAIVERAARVNSLQITPEQVVVTAGGTGALLAALLCLCSPGDEVLVPDPGWPGYDGILAAAGVRDVRYPLTPSLGWQPDLDTLDALISPRTQVLLLNSPSNPGGAVFPAQTVAALVTLAARHDLWVVSDECYDDLVFDGAHVSPAALDPDGRVLTIGSCSKSYAMTGWRVGWALTPPVLASAMNVVVGAEVNNLPLLTMRAAEAALTGPQACVADMRAAYQARRDLAVDLLGARGLARYVPAGAFYLLVEVPSLVPAPRRTRFDSIAFAEALLTTRGIAVAPGAAFGATIPGHVRITLAAAPEALRAGIAGLVEFATAWPG